MGYFWLNKLLGESERNLNCPQICFIADKTNQLSCDVAIIGGGVSGLYVAETLLRLHKETDVCLFERSDRVGGRIHDYTFQRMPGVPVSKLF